jgi:transposase-like protein
MARKARSVEWEGHVSAARRQGKSLRAYAQEHGLSAWTLYEASRRLRGTVKSAGGGFAKVAIMPAPSFAAALRVQLANGVKLEVPIEAGDPVALAAALGVLAQLPCSA